MKHLGLLSLLLIASCLLAACPQREDRGEADGPDVVNWEGLREEMVQRIREDGVTSETVLAAMLAVERHRFVSRAYRRRAYRLEPLPIEDDQTISSPYVVAAMTEMLDLDGSERVLEIGTGSGYQAAILARLVPQVYTMEIRPGLAETAERRLAALGFRNVTVRCGDGYQGWPSKAPFDAIIVTAAPPRVPQALVDQLAPGGVLVVPVGRQTGPQQLIRVRRDKDGTVTKEDGPRVIFVPMIEGE